MDAIKELENELKRIEDNKEYSNLSIRELKKALEIFTSDKYPIQYAESMDSLGNTFRTLSEFEKTKQGYKVTISLDI